jgi:hypothetical protein
MSYERIAIRSHEEAAFVLGINGEVQYNLRIGICCGEMLSSIIFQAPELNSEWSVIVSCYSIYVMAVSAPRDIDIMALPLLRGRLLLLPRETSRVDVNSNSLNIKNSNNDLDGINTNI